MLVIIAVVLELYGESYNTTPYGTVCVNVCAVQELDFLNSKALLSVAKHASKTNPAHRLTGYWCSSFYKRLGMIRRPKGGAAIAIGLVSFATLTAIYYSHYSQTRDRAVMRAGVERDKERLRAIRRKKKEEEGS